MCGICGQFNFGTAEPVDADEIRRMSDTMAHRGPDDAGTYVSGDLGLGFRRLSIIDLAGGRQPMSDEDQTVWVVCNGEIYNYRKLRDELVGLGHRFRTESDTETIVHGYKQWGDDVLLRLNGMFGLAVWDAHRRKLLIARDRAGVKGLYYQIDHGRLLFGSEIRPIAENLDVRLEPDPEAMSLILRYRYTPSPMTVYRGLRKLGPGMKLVIEDGQVREERWWQFEPELFDPPPTIEEAEEQLLDLYRQAVKRQLVSDVPLGLLLSGGLDSGLLLALMNEFGSDWKTFTVGFGASYGGDELEDAETTARVLGAPNSQVCIDQDDFEKSLPDMISILEEPISSPASVLYYHVCKRAAEDVKVALIGQGPDELLGGYKRHLGLRYGHWWGSLPGWIQSPVGAALRQLPRNEGMKRALDSLGEPQRFQRYQQVFSLIPERQVSRLFRDGLLPAGSHKRMAECWGDLTQMIDGTDELGGFNFLEVRTELPDELLAWGDKVSMHHSLEVRVPYLDHDIIEYAERLPAAYKVRLGRRKWLHSRVCRQFLPEAMLHRKKRGFGHDVVDAWFRNSIAGRIGDTLLDEQSLIFTYLEPKVVREMVDDHQRGRHDHHKVLFNLVMMEEWMRMARV